MSTMPVERLIALRHELHRHAELSSRESKTARIVADWFGPLAPDETLTQLGGTGLAFVFAGSKPGRTVLLRCELDALPIEEANRFAHRSVTPGVSHKCGHDGHMTIMAAVGNELAQERPASGRVVLLFQPAEETGVGAAAVVADPRFERIRPDYAFALHNLPRYAPGQVLVRRGTFHCGSVGMVVALTGRSSHAAYPEHGRSPIAAVARVTERLAGLPGAPALAGKDTLVTVTHVCVGQPNLGISPGEATMMVSLRARTDADLDGLRDAAERLVRDQARESDLDCVVRWEEAFRAGVSDDAAVDAILSAAAAANCPVASLEEPMAWSEDFAEFTSRWPGAMFGLGAGEDQPQLHSPDYDFPDALIEPGARVFVGVTRRLLG